MGSERIKNDLREFEQSVRALSDGIGKASDVWNDRKYTELSNSVSFTATVLTPIFYCIALEFLCTIPKSLFLSIPIPLSYSPDRSASVI